MDTPVVDGKNLCSSTLYGYWVLFRGFTKSYGWERERERRGMLLARFDDDHQQTIFRLSSESQQTNSFKLA